jgi:hypothetical protein
MAVLGRLSPTAWGAQDRTSLKFCGTNAKKLSAAAGARMQRRTFRQIRAASEAAHHHNVYVVLLAPDAGSLREVRAENPRVDPAKPCVYVGMTGLSPEERFQNHKRGLKAARVVQRYGLRLLPELYEVFNPMPFEAALEMERELAEDLRAQGYTVTGGH